MKVNFSKVAALQMGSNPDAKERPAKPRQQGDNQKQTFSPHYPVDRRQQGYDFGQPSRQMQ